MITRKKLLQQRKPCAILLERLRESKWPPNYHSWIFRDLPNISRLLKILWFGHITTKHRSQVSKFHSNFICQFFFLLAMATKAVVAWSSVIKRAMVRRMFIWGGIVKKGNRVVLECSYWLCILLSSPKPFLPPPPTIKDCMTGSVSCINICFIGEGSCIWWKCSCA